MTNIETYIDRKVGMLSGELAAHLVETDKIKPEAARKRIERTSSPVHKITGLFADNQSFVYHSDHYGSKEYYEALYTAFENGGKRCFAIIKAIEYHHGLIKKENLANYSFSPIDNIKGHVTYNTLLDKLLRIEVIGSFDDEHYELHPYLRDLKEPNLQYFKALNFSTNLILNQFSNWAKNTGLISYNTGRFDSHVAGFQFGYTSPSYISGFTQYKDGVPKPGFLAADALVGSIATETDIDFFVQKINAIKASNKTIRILPVLLSNGLKPEALAKLKQCGAMIGNIRELFGEGYEELLKNLINTITNAGTILKKNPEQYLNLMSQLTKLVDGKTNNLRGDLFELAVGYYFGQICKFLEVGKKVIPAIGDKKRDIDVFAIFEDRTVAIECKGYNYPLDEAYVERYLGDIVPSIRKWMLNTFPEKAQRFEIWSTGGFTEKAQEMLLNAKTSTKKYSIDYLGKQEILEKAMGLKTSKFSEILKDYYFKEIT